MALVERALANSSRPGDVCVDLFAEFDSTLIGCERLGRKARLMAMDPGCADVVCRRWEKYTGKAAVLGGDGRTLAQIARLGRKETVK